MKMWAHEEKMIEIAQNHNNEKLLQQFFEEHGYVAAVDIPMCFHYNTAMKAFPDAKVKVYHVLPQSSGRPTFFLRINKISYHKFCPDRNTKFPKIPPD